VVLRAELDALPITEQTDVPFASTVTTTYNGVATGVGHMCGHDCHVAILLGVAHVLSKAPRTWSGTVLFLFQPSEEGAPDGEDGGASVMLKDSRLTAMHPDAFFALHVISNMPVGAVAYRAGAALASSDIFRIRVDGKQTHSGYPWTGIDPIVSAAQIVLGLQTIESRQVAVTEEPSVLSVCMINGGIKENVIPASVELAGTLRAFDEAMREDIHRRIARVAECIACSCGAKARTTIRPLYPVTVNHPELTRRIVPGLRRSVGADNVFEAGKLSASEDFGIFLRNYPGSIFYLGCAPAGIDLRSAAINHSPLFFVDEAALLLGMKCMASVAMDFLADFALDVGGPVPVCSSVL